MISRCGRGKSLKMPSGRTDWSWQTGSSTPNGRRTKETSKEPGKTIS